MNGDSFECTVPGCPCTRLVDEMISPRPASDSTYTYNTETIAAWDLSAFECTNPECDCSYKTTQPDPVPNTQPAIWDLVFEDMGNRDELGLKRYGTRLQPHNGRDALRDLYEEILDAVVYARQAIFERDGR